MDAVTKSMVAFTLVCVYEFADRYGLSKSDAYKYLRQYQGIAFLKEFYNVEHTLSFDDAVDDLTTICRKSGGAI